jgi:hypothetical protein
VPELYCWSVRRIAYSGHLTGLWGRQSGPR